MKLNDLKLFIEVVEAGGMTQAASKLGLSQPGLSRTIRDLELKLDARLLERTGRGVELTKSGQIFLQFCIQTIDAYDLSQHKIRRVTRSIPASLTIAIPLRISSMLTPALLTSFQRHLPQVDVHIYEATSEQIVRQVNAGKRDVGIVYQPPVSAAQLTQPVATENLYLVGTSDLIMGARKPVKLVDIAKMPMLLPSRESQYRRLIDASFQKAGAMPDVVRELEVVDALLAFAMESEGVTILAYSNVCQEIERGDIAARKIVSPGIKRTISMILSKKIDHFAAIRIKKIINESVVAVSKQCRWKKIQR